MKYIISQIDILYIYLCNHLMPRVSRVVFGVFPELCHTNGRTRVVTLN